MACTDKTDDRNPRRDELARLKSQLLVADVTYRYGPKSGITPRHAAFYRLRAYVICSTNENTFARN